MKTTLEIYGQYLLNTHINYTNLADHAEELSHDSVHRFLKGSKLSPRMVWDRVKDQIVFSQSGCVIFEDTVRSAFSIDRSKKKRKVDETGGAMPYVQVCQLDWSEQDLAEGKTVKLHGFPMDSKVKLFRVAVSSDRTEPSWQTTALKQVRPLPASKAHSVGKLSSFTERKTTDRNCQMSMPKKPLTTKPQLRRRFGLGSAQRTEAPCQNDGLSNKTTAP